MASRFAVVPSAQAEVGARGGVELHFAQLRERIELDDYPIAPQSGINGEEQVVDAERASTT